MALQEDCLFCQIVRGTRQADILRRDNDIVIFKDIHPQAPVHLLVVPTSHIKSINDLRPGEEAIVGTMVTGARTVARELEIDESGYRLMINVERGAGQVIFHLHMHLMGGWRE
jgi:histidine triad (HIT) family protein